MATQLAPNESVIKSWNYGKTKGGVKSTANLTVTNQRIISTITYKKAMERNEIPLSEVKSVYASTASPRARILVVLFGIITIVVIIGIVILVKEYKRCHSATLDLEVTTKGAEGTPFTIGMSSIKSSSGFLSAFFSRFRRKTKVLVDREAATDIVENFGSIICSYRSN